MSGKDKENAFKALETRARQAHSFRLAALAAEVRMHTAGHFDEVLKTIDNLLAKLGDEEQADIKKVDECRESYKDMKKLQGPTAILWGTNMYNTPKHRFTLIYYTNNIYR